MRNLTPAIVLCIAFVGVYSQAARAGRAGGDNGDGTYTNPIIHADYSDPDAIRVGEDYYMTASSFNAVPGLPILHSKDLVNWRLINHAIRTLFPIEHFRKPQHGGGVWAPSIRFHKGEFYIYYGDPDFGIYVTKAKDPAGEWSEPMLIMGGKGLIDPCPLWDDDGKAYLVHAFAGSRAGIKSVIVMHRMNSAGTKVIDDGAVVFDGHDADPTVEGPKFHKIGEYYYISAPAGGVATGWQIVLRSKNVFGPYQKRVVLAQGKTAVNGPHQGALVDTPTGEWWFLHFQDKGAYGRILHLQPVQWKRGFPVVGSDADGDGTGEPVASFRKPDVSKSFAVSSLQDSDEFTANSLGVQWQWHANPTGTWAFPFPSKGVLKLFSVQTADGYRNLWDLSNLLLQKFPAEEFSATAKVKLEPRLEGERFGLVIMGIDYSLLAVENRGGTLYVSQSTAIDADKGNAETSSAPVAVSSREMYLRVVVSKGAVCSFHFSGDDIKYTQIGSVFKAREGRWIGAKIGFVFTRPGRFNDGGSAEIDWFRIEK
jgi:beta-xylosidase